MANLLEYMSWRGDLDIKAAPFCKIDALVFATLSYIDFQDCVDQDVTLQITMEEAWKKFEALPDFEKRCDLGAMLNPKIIDLFRECAHSQRFSSIKMSGYQTVYDENMEEQFAAICFEPEKGVTCVTFRGTDDTLIGWKEDFNMGYLDVIASQGEAKVYLEKACEKLRGEIIVAGHSKGANLAMYSAVNVSDKFRKRITSVYNFDGPGLSKNVKALPSFGEIKDRIVSVYPEMCVVGTIFGHMENCIIAKSDEFAVMQHDPLSWLVLGTDFVKAEEFKSESVFFEKTVNGWIDTLTKEQIEDFVSTLFGIVFSTGARTNTDLEENRLQFTAKIVHAFAQMDMKKRLEFWSMLGDFKKVAKGNVPFFNLFSLPELNFGK